MVAKDFIVSDNDAMEHFRWHLKHNENAEGAVYAVETQSDGRFKVVVRATTQKQMQWISGFWSDCVTSIRAIKSKIEVK